MCKTLKFDYIDEWHEPESVQKMKMLKIQWDFERQMDHPIQGRNTDQVLINKKKEFVNSEVFHSSRIQSENKRRWKTGKIPEPCLRTSCGT